MTMSLCTPHATILGARTVRPGALIPTLHPGRRGRLPGAYRRGVRFLPPNPDHWRIPITTPVTNKPGSSSGPGTGTARAGFRPDVEGLRAVAVSLVVLYHLWPTTVTGGFVGVDIFFVISGFLITSHLLARPLSSGKDLTGFWARRIRRLLPASLLVLVVTSIGVRLVAPVTQWAGTAWEIISSALYVQNWRLAGSSVDYLTAESAPSAVQHFWSLSVEEQFYLLWPILLLAALKLGRGRSASPWVKGTIWAMALLSLSYSIWATAVAPASAYFITPTRMWELAVGGIVATLMPLGRSHLRRFAPALAWMGVAAIATTAALFTNQTPFPGYTALLPVLGAAAVIWAAAEGPLSPMWLLAWRPAQWLGGISYSVYLWHWPLIVLVPFITSGPLGWLDKVVILIMSLLLAALTKKFVEDQFRFPERRLGIRHAYRFAAVAMMVVVAVGAAQLVESNLRLQSDKNDLQAAVAGHQSCFGAAALAQGTSKCPIQHSGKVVPTAALAADDKPQAYADHCFTQAPYEKVRTCSYGHGATQIALVGNSHAGHWLPALRQLAESEHWTITTFVASECTASTASLAFPAPADSQGCRDWGQKVLKRTAGHKYDLVITSERNVDPVRGHTVASSYPAWEKGYREYLASWATADTPVLVLHDTPFPSDTIKNIPDCVAEHGDDLTQCSGAADTWIPSDPLATAAAAMNAPGIRTVDLNRYFCRTRRCYGVNGTVVTYFDGSHMSATYSRTLAPYLLGPIRKSLG